jgi:hypothetical protein
MRLVQGHQEIDTGNIRSSIATVPGDVTYESRVATIAVIETNKLNLASILEIEHTN